MSVLAYRPIAVYSFRESKLNPIVGLHTYLSKQKLKVTTIFTKFIHNSVHEFFLFLANFLYVHSSYTIRIVCRLSMLLRYNAATAYLLTI